MTKSKLQMSRVTKVLAAVALMALAPAAFSASTWDLTTCSTSANLGDSVKCASNGTASGLVLSGFSNGTGNSSYPSDPASTVNFLASNVYDHGNTNGLGVIADNETANPAGPHAIDNGYGTDALLIQFTGGPVTLTGLTVGWNATNSNVTSDNNGAKSNGGATKTYNDSDLSVFVWTDTTAPTMTSLSPTTLTASSWKLVQNSANVSGQLSVNQSFYSSYWLISAYSSAYGGGSSFTSGDDAFKILTIAGNTCANSSNVTNNTCGGTKVPEPGSLALFGAALIGFVGSRRRKQQAT